MGNCDLNVSISETMQVVCIAKQTGEVWQQPQQTCSFPILSNHVIRVSAQLSQCREGLSIPTLTTILCGYLAFFLWVSGSFIYILKISSKTRTISTVWPIDRQQFFFFFLQMVTSWQKCRWRRTRACCRQNLMRYQCTKIAVHSRFHVAHFLPPLCFLAVLPTDPLLPAILCVRRIWWSEIAVCESMPLPVQTSSEGLKKGMKKKIKIKWW